MELRRVCQDRKCKAKFSPVAEWQVFCSDRCRNRETVKRFRERQRYGTDGPGVGKRQRHLFPKTDLKAKPPKSERRAKQDDLFPVGEAMPVQVATLCVGFPMDDNGIISPIHVIGRKKRRSRIAKSEAPNAIAA